MCMARPRRPEVETRLVREAAQLVRGETGITSAKAVSATIAERVVLALADELEADPIERAFAAIERDLIGSPFHRLASCPEINTVSEFVERRLEKFRSRAGRQLAPTEDAAERRAILDEVQAALASRYDWQLRR